MPNFNKGNDDNERRGSRRGQSEEPERTSRGSRRGNDEEENTGRGSRRGESTERESRGSGSARRGSSSREEESGESNTSGRGWGPAKARKEELQEMRGHGMKEFWLSDGEEAIIQFLDDEPLCVDGHTIKDRQGNFKFEPCQYLAQKHCVMCREKINKGWKAFFKILDYRGEWDEVKKAFKWNTEVEKIFPCGSKLLDQLKAYADSKGKKLSQLVILITASGVKTKKTYNLQPAEENDQKLHPIKYETEYDDLEDLIVPKSDAALEKMGFEEPENNNNSRGGRGDRGGRSSRGGRDNDRGNDRGRDSGRGRGRNEDNDDLAY